MRNRIGRLGDGLETSTQLAASCLLGGTAGWSLTATGAAASRLADTYHVGLAGVGALTSAFAVTYAAFQLPAGALIDRFGVRRAGGSGLVLVAVAYSIGALTPSFTLALVCRAAAGVGASMCYVAGAEAARRSGTGTMGQGLFGGFAAAAGGVALVVVPGTVGLLGWRASWLTCVAIACVGLAVLLSPATTAFAAGRFDRPVRPEMPRGGTVLADAQLYRLAAVHTVTFGGSIVLSNWTALILQRTWGMTGAAAEGTASLILLTTVVSRPAGGYLARRHPLRMRGWTFGSLLIGGAAVLALAHRGPFAVALGAAVILGVASGLPFAATFASAQRRHAERPAAAIGLMNANANFLIVIGTPLVGAALEGGHTALTLAGFAVLWVAPLLALPKYDLAVNDKDDVEESSIGTARSD
ncbi:nitrate/nitrite transporter [Nocardia sp. NPDC057030]|uniref:MFS transporter n=1 Tax=unclassified Nocardia TaxID=2637762 RepID=UPI003637154D